MPDIAPIAIDLAATSPAPAATKTDPGSEAPFGSILSAEISARQQDSATSTATTGAGSQSPEATDPALTDQIGQSATGDTEQLPSNAATANEGQGSQPTDPNQFLPGNNPTVMALIFGDLATFPGQANNSSGAVFEQAAGDQTMSTKGVANIVVQTAPVDSTGQLTLDGEFMAQATATATATPAAATSEPILSAQLKQLIAGSETKTIVISQAATSTATLADLNSLTPGIGLANSLSEGQEIHPANPVAPGQIAADSVKVGSVVSDLARSLTDNGQNGGKAATVTSNGETISTLRHELQGQFTEARLEQKLNDGSDSQSTANQDPKSNSQSTLATPALSTTTGELTSTFAQQVSLGIQDLTQSQAGTASAKTVLLPSGVTVPEESVMQQIIDRFQISPRLQENRFNISLHPAELGALKIELTLRDGVIRANVVAQTQQVQEVLEKNMPRLKAVLEGQGFTVENIQVFTESAGLTEFDFFDQHFSRDQDSTNSSSQKSDTSGFSQSFDTAGYDGVPLTSSVNIQA